MAGRKTPLKKPKAVETEPAIPLNPRFSHLTPFLQFVAALLSIFFYDDLVGFTLEFIGKVILVGHNLWENDEQIESCIQFYDASFDLLRTIGSAGSGKGQFKGVGGFCFDNLRRIVFASDYSNHRIHKIDESGEFLCHFGEEVLKCPIQLSLSPDRSTLAVADYGQDELFLFSVDTGELLRRSEPVFDAPKGVCHLSNDELLVGYSKHVSLVESANLKVKSEWKSDEFEWDGVHHIVVDESTGVVFISDFGANRVAQFSKSGDYLGSITSHGGEPLKCPAAIAVDVAGILFVRSLDGIRVFDEVNSKFGFGNVGAILVIDL